MRKSCHRKITPEFSVFLSKSKDPPGHQYSGLSTTARWISANGSVSAQILTDQTITLFCPVVLLLFTPCFNRRSSAVNHMHENDVPLSSLYNHHSNAQNNNSIYIYVRSHQNLIRRYQRILLAYPHTICNLYIFWWHFPSFLRIAQPSWQEPINQSRLSFLCEMFDVHL